MPARRRDFARPANKAPGTSAPDAGHIPGADRRSRLDHLANTGSETRDEAAAADADALRPRSPPAIPRQRSFPPAPSHLAIRDSIPAVLYRSSFTAPREGPKKNKNPRVYNKKNTNV